MQSLRAFACSIKRTKESNWELAIRIISSTQADIIIDFECQPVLETWDVRDVEYEGCFTLVKSR